MAEMYTLPGTNTVYRSENLPGYGEFLRDMNLSRTWQDGRGLVQGHLVGYLLEDGKLFTLRLDLDGTRKAFVSLATQPTLLERDLIPCEVKPIIIDLAAWSPGGAT